MGYRKVYVYNEGLPEWTKRGYPVQSDTVYPKIQIPSVSAAALNDRLKREENMFVLDLRDENDRKAGWIKGSTHIDLEILTDKLKELPKNKAIILVDLHGKQSLTAARYLATKGFKDVTVLEGGFMDGWAKGNYPVEK
jgi:rhodanese-related sulfurtransferase